MADRPRSARRSGPPRRPPQPRDILEQHSRGVRALVGDLRTLIRDVVPAVEERVYTGWRGLGYHDPQAGYFCGIFPLEDRVKLGFEHGAELKDPEGLLVERGRQVGYVILRPGERLPRAQLTRLIQQALIHGAA